MSLRRSRSHWSRFSWTAISPVVIVPPGHLFRFPKTSPILAFSGIFGIDGVTTNAVETSITAENFIPETAGGKLCNDRLVRGHFRSSLRSSAFAKTTSVSPISAVSGNQIKVYHDGKFIISKLRVSYVRKPAKISLLLNQNCDIAEEFHQEICDRAVLYIKELIGSPDWEVKLRDMMTNKD